MDSRIKNTSFTIASDVKMCFVARKEHLRFLAHKKGATPEMVEVLDNNLESPCTINKRDIERHNRSSGFCAAAD